LNEKKRKKEKKIDFLSSTLFKKEERRGRMFGN
jgi:hypothetical protein